MVSFRLFGWPVLYRFEHGRFGYYYLQFSSCPDDFVIVGTTRDLVYCLVKYIYA